MRLSALLLSPLLSPRLALEQAQRTHQLALISPVTSDVPPPPASAPPSSAVVIGGGWAGFGTAWALAQRGVAVTVLEANDKAVGGLAAGWLGPDGRPVELGIHGFWRSYVNCFRLVEQLGLRADDVFTPWATPALYTSKGLSVVAPIFADLPRLPTPLGSALYPSFKTLSLVDRASALALLYEFVDFDGGAESWERYDGISARELLYSKGVSKALYDGFLEPMLLVLPMAPGEEVSAAAALSLLQYFALEHQSDFDVRWLRASLTTAIFDRWVEALEAAGARVLRGKRVSDVVVEGGRATRVVCADGSAYEADAVVSAVGISGAKGLLRSCASLAKLPEFGRMMHLRGVDVVAVRLWFRRHRALPHPSNVVGGGVPVELGDVGWTFYDLSTLQAPTHDDHSGTVIECDYYHAAPLLPLPDADVVRVALRGLRQLLPDVFADADVEAAALAHASVLRAPGAVSHFTPGAFRHLPRGVRSPSVPNLYFAGDWIDRGGHRSWSQEKALVTGLQAAACVVQDSPRLAGMATRLPESELLPLEVEATEPHVELARTVNRQLLRPPLALLQSVFRPPAL